MGIYNVLQLKQLLIFVVISWYISSTIPHLISSWHGMDMSLYLFLSELFSLLCVDIFMIVC